MEKSEQPLVAATPPSLGLPPVDTGGARLLVLGSFPSRRSLEAGRYYAHPRNHFWPILATLAAPPRSSRPGPGLLEAPADWDSRYALLARLGLSLWDVLASCRRPGSLDVDIRDALPNDLGAFLAARPGIDTLLLNGGGATALFGRFLASGRGLGALGIGEPIRLELGGRRFVLIRLPSTSPIPTAAYPGGRAKLESWRRAVLGGGGRKAEPPDAGWGGDGAATRKGRSS